MPATDPMTSETRRYAICLLRSVKESARALFLIFAVGCGGSSDSVDEHSTSVPSIPAENFGAGQHESIKASSESGTINAAIDSNLGLERLPPFQDRAIGSQQHVRVQQRAFRPGPYIRAAVALQTMGRDHACEQMMALVERDPDAEQVFILCRMLFTRRETSEFRRPGIGGAVFLAGTSYAEWPLEPIELVDGVPFLIIWGYKLGGEAETPEAYLRYCMANCDWSAFRFREQSRAEMRTALKKLLASSKWQRRLEAQEADRLTEQIE